MTSMHSSINMRFSGAIDQDPFGYQWMIETLNLWRPNCRNSHLLFPRLIYFIEPIWFWWVLNSVDHMFTLEMNSTLLQRYNPEEVKQALFQMHPSKAPGPDGMSHFFFQKFEHIVGQDVRIAILSVLNYGHMLLKMNYTHIVFIPKNNDLKHMSDYRPISLGNIISRIVSKVLVNRLKLVLPMVISNA